MVIDFHTHAFPDKIANKTVEALGKMANYTPLTDGTVRGLSEKLQASGVDLAVVLPVITKPAQFETVNRFAAEISADNENHPNIISFGGIHPDSGTDSGEYKAQIAFIRSLGLGGIKIHPDYQGVYIDDERYVNIVREAIANGLTVITHAGIDDGYRGQPPHCPPERAAHLISLVESACKCETLPIVFAHGGGNKMHDEVMQHLSGKNVYIDMSLLEGYGMADEAVMLIKKHGAERLLFASDCPWGDPKLGVEFINSLPISDDEKDQILWGTAKKLLEL